MLVCTRVRQPVEKPGPLQLAIREWQQQLIEMAEASQRQANGGALRVD
jgi:hypothetical protein